MYSTDIYCLTYFLSVTECACIQAYYFMESILMATEIYILEINKKYTVYKFKIIHARCTGKNKKGIDYCPGPDRLLSMNFRLEKHIHH